MVLDFGRRENMPHGIYNYFIKNLVDNNLGDYKTGKIIGWGFPNAHTYKRYLHFLFREESFYPKSILIKKDWVINNRGKVEEFLQNKKIVVKADKGHSGSQVFIVSSVEDIIGKIDNNFWVAQRIVEPRLYDGRKFDMRIYHLIIRKGGVYYNIISKVGIVKICGNKYTKDGLNGFLTNVSMNKGKGNMYEFFDFMDKLESDESKRKQIIINIYDVIRNYSKILSKKLDEENQKLEKKPIYQMMMYGPDIIIDESNNAFLLETNSSPGYLINGEMIYAKQRELMDELAEKVIRPILSGVDIKLDGLKGKLFYIERLGK